MPDDRHKKGLILDYSILENLLLTGLSLDLIQDAVLRAISASEDVASTALIVHPLNDRLVGLYEKVGFIRCPQLSPITMMLPFT